MSVEVAGQRAAVGEVFGQQPGTALLTLAAAVAAFVAIWWTIHWLRLTPADRFARALAAPDAVTVLTHPNPDPDAMASALAVAELAEAVGTDAALQYPGEIRHQENRAFETVLGLELSQVSDSAGLAADAVVLVDHGEPRGFDGAEDVEPYAVVDHHPHAGHGSAFTDVRVGHGACASILAEYLRTLGWSPRGGERPLDTDLATALLYGIFADTGRLTHGATEAEFRAAAYLFPAVDERALRRISNPPVDEDVLEVKARAIDRRRKDGPFLFSDVETVGNADAVAQAADELQYLEGVTAVVVCGRHDGTVHLSGRSDDDRVHMGRTLKAAVDDIPGASAGGHARMGGGQLPADRVDGDGSGGAVARGDLEDRVFAAMAGEL